MSEKRYPSFRLSYKAKDGTKYDIGVCWESERFPGLFDVKPVKEPSDGQYPKMRMSDAAAKCEGGDGFISLSAPKSAASSPKPTPSGNGDPDIPF